jgi:hypothetical protein
VSPAKAVLQHDLAVRDVGILNDVATHGRRHLCLLGLTQEKTPASPFRSPQGGKATGTQRLTPHQHGGMGEKRNRGCQSCQEAISADVGVSPADACSVAEKYELGCDGSAY